MLLEITMWLTLITITVLLIEGTYRTLRWIIKKIYGKD